ncbi:MAG: hypothetical protein H0U22_04160 [Geodermatophilaceae bacterium]|nr:hypothetical protein [Geodermatophilaceae bacterium]
MLITTFYPSMALGWILGSANAVLYLVFGVSGIVVPPQVWLALYVDATLFQFWVYVRNRRYNVSPYDRQGSPGIRGMLMSVLAAPIYASSFIATLFRLPARFVVTPKNDASTKDGLRSFRRHLVWAALLGGALIAAMWRGYANLDVMMWPSVALLISLTPLAIWWLERTEETADGTVSSERPTPVDRVAPPGAPRPLPAAPIRAPQPIPRVAAPQGVAAARHPVSAVSPEPVPRFPSPVVFTRSGGATPTGTQPPTRAPLSTPAPPPTPAQRPAPPAAPAVEAGPRFPRPSATATSSAVGSAAAQRSTQTAAPSTNGRPETRQAAQRRVAPPPRPEPAPTPQSAARTSSAPRPSPAPRPTAPPRRPPSGGQRQPERTSDPQRPESRVSTPEQRRDSGDEASNHPPDEEIGAVA